MFFNLKTFISAPSRQSLPSPKLFSTLIIDPSLPPANEPWERNLTEEEIKVLVDDGILFPSPKPGYLCVSAALLSSSLPSTPTASVCRVGATPDPNQTFDLPSHERSVQALEFYGYTTSAATSTYQRWHTRPDPRQNPDDLVDYAYGDITILKMKRYESLTPKQALLHIGFNQDFQDALLDQEFAAIFESESLHYWVKDMIENNFNTHMRLSERLKSLATRTPGDACLPGTQAALDHKFPISPDHVVLYKGTAACDVERWIEQDRRLNMGAIIKDEGGDFHHHGLALYWTPEKEVAEQHRKWVARRSPRSDTSLIRIQVPISFLNSLTTSTLWYSPDWKEHVWRCKTEHSPPR